MSVNRTIRVALFLLGFTLLFGKLEAHASDPANEVKVTVIDMTGNPNVLPPLPPGVIRLPFDVTANGTGATAAAAAQDALNKAVQQTVDGAKGVGAIFGAGSVFIEVLVSQQVGAPNRDATGTFHASWRLKGNLVLKPTQWPFPIILPPFLGAW